MNSNLPLPVCVCVCVCVVGNPLGPMQANCTAVSLHLWTAQVQSAQGERATVCGGGEAKRGRSTCRKRGKLMQRVRRDEEKRDLTLLTVWYKHTSHINQHPVHVHTHACTHLKLHLLINSGGINKDNSFPALFLSLCSIHPALLCVAKPQSTWQLKWLCVLPFIISLLASASKQNQKRLVSSSRQYSESCECAPTCGFVSAGNISVRMEGGEEKRRGAFPHGELGNNETDINGARGETETDKTGSFLPYMEGGSLLSVQGLGDKHVAADGVYVVDPTRGLISSCSCDAVADANVLVLIWADLRTEPEKQVQQRRQSGF